MEKNKSDDILIEQYHKDELSLAEKTAFEVRLKKDKVFAEKAQEFKDIIDAIAKKEANDFRTKLKGIQTELKQDDFFEQQKKKWEEDNPKSNPVPLNLNNGKGKIVPMKNNNWWKMAAAILLLITVGYYFFQPTANLTRAELFAKNFQPKIEKTTLVISRLDAKGMGNPNSEMNEQLKPGIIAYRQGEYGKAKDSLSIFLTKYPDNEIAQFYLGMVYLNESNYGRAVELLSPLGIKTDFLLQDEATYYLAMSYTMLDTPKGTLNAIQLYQQILDSADSNFKVEAAANLEFLQND